MDKIRMRVLGLILIIVYLQDEIRGGGFNYYKPMVSNS